MNTTATASASRIPRVRPALMSVRRTLVVSFSVPNANIIPLREMVDTWSGVSVRTFIGLQPCSFADKFSVTTSPTCMLLMGKRWKLLDTRSLCASSWVDFNSKLSLWSSMMHMGWRIFCWVEFFYEHILC